MARRTVRKRKAPPAKIVHLEPVTDQRVLALRFRFKQLKANALYGASEAEWMAEVRRLAGQCNPTPEQWVEAAEKATTKCDRCHNGIYSWGACINGQMQHSAPCYRCQGKGRLDQADHHRNRVYDNHRKII